MKKLAVICTHPIQYLAPVFRELAGRPELQIKVFYGWQGTAATNDPGFGQKVTWDIPLLEGYEYEFVENVATDQGTHHFKGIDLPTLNQRIETWNADALLIYGWSYRSHLAALRHFKGRIPVLFRGDSTLLNERPGLKRIIRRIYLRWIYRNIDVALAVGTNNAKYFEAHWIPRQRIVVAPHSVDNRRFAGNSESLQLEAEAWRSSLGIPQTSVVFLFSGKLEPNKFPELLLAAFSRLQNKDVHLVFAGSGELESQLRAAANDRVHFIGFQNQSKMPLVYRIGDVVVLTSRSETWGLALNEAMASSRALIASDKVGAAVDLIDQGRNGWIFKSGDVGSLADTLHEAANLGVEGLRELGKYSQVLVQKWSIEHQVDAIVAAVHSLKSPKASA